MSLASANEYRGVDRLIVNMIESSNRRGKSETLYELMGILFESDLIVFVAQSLLSIASVPDFVEDFGYHQYLTAELINIGTRSETIDVRLADAGTLPTLLLALRSSDCGEESLFTLPLLKLCFKSYSAKPTMPSERLDTIAALIATLRSIVTRQLQGLYVRVYEYQNLLVIWCEMMLSVCGGSDPVDSQLHLAVAADVVPVMMRALTLLKEQPLVEGRKICISAMPLLSFLFKCESHINNLNQSNTGTHETENLSPHGSTINDPNNNNFQTEACRNNIIDTSLDFDGEIDVTISDINFVTNRGNCDDYLGALFVDFALSPAFDAVFAHASVENLDARCSMLLLLNRAAGLVPNIVERVFTEERLCDLAHRNIPANSIRDNHALISLVARLIRSSDALARHVFTVSFNYGGEYVPGALVTWAVKAMRPQKRVTDRSRDMCKAERESLRCEIGLLESLVSQTVVSIAPATAPVTDAALEEEMAGAGNGSGFNDIAWRPDLQKIQSVIAHGLLWAALWSYSNNINSSDAGTLRDGFNATATGSTVKLAASSAGVPADMPIGVDSDTVARLLRLLRRLITSAETDVMREQRARGEEVRPNPFVKFYSSDNVFCTVFDLLMAADCTLGGDDNPVLRELLVMHAAPECSGLFSFPERQHRLELVEAGDSDWWRGAKDVARFAQGFAGGWREAFDAYIACDLEEHGFPRRLVSHYQCSNTTSQLQPRPLPVFAPAPVPVFANGAPSLPALSLLRRRARLFMGLQLSDCHIPAAYDYHNVHVQFGHCGPNNHQKKTFQIKVRRNRFDSYGDLDCNLAYFSLALHVFSRGVALHTCFLPPGLRPSDAPFVTLYCHDNQTPCFSHPIAMPDTDTAFGEYKVPINIDTLTYPAGTVLMRPRSSVPCQFSTVYNSYNLHTDTPVFIVFKPCAAHLLRGAVPVGRVVSSDNHDEDYSPRILQDDAPPFTEERIRLFESLCITGPCSERCGIYLAL